jgi:hypothetical protein
MIILRILSVLTGTLVALLAPQFALDVGADIVGHSVQPDSKVMGLALLTVALCASGFLFVGAAGHRLTRSPLKRLIAGLLLLFPAAGCAWILFFSSTPPLVWMAGPLLCFTGLVFGTFSFPAVNKRSRRPMRPRDYDEAHLNERPAD